MSAFKDRTGERYGRLVAVKCVGKDQRGRPLWECKCDCGGTKIVSSDNLSSGKSKSCGCLLREFLHKSGNQFGLYEDRKEAILRVQYSHLKRRHSKFTGTVMSFSDFVKKSTSPCFYCGLEYSKEIQDRKNETISDGLLSDTVVRCNGIDRIDSSTGYTAENTVPCCKICNSAKNTMTQDEFRNWVKRIYRHFIEEED